MIWSVLNVKKLHIFLSHSSSDAQLAQEVCRLLENEGHTCFIAPRDIRAGHEYAEELINGIDSSDAMLLLLSKQAGSSPHVLREVERAVSKNKPIIVYKLEDFTLNKSMEYFLMTHQWLDSRTDLGHEAIVKSINSLNIKKTKNKKSTYAAISGIVFLLIIAAAFFIKSSFSMAHNDNIQDTKLESTTVFDASDLSCSSTITFGTYNDEPIDWRVIHISPDTGTAVVISDRILTMKAFDAAEGGEYNFLDGVSYWTTATADIDIELQRMLRGDNRWEFSNIRTWLNSSNEMVSYDDQPPAATAMSMHHNGYETEAGFLNGFTENELALIVPTEHETNGSMTTDMVFLLSSDELSWLNAADVSIYAKPTDAAIAQDNSEWYSTNLADYGTKEHFWWLRDADTSTACKVMLVNISRAKEHTGSDAAGLEGYGIRPAMTIKLNGKR